MNAAGKSSVTAAFLEGQDDELETTVNAFEDLLSVLEAEEAGDAGLANSISRSCFAPRSV